MFALADCNNFYVSCERIFRPGLVGRPVVVLSNNDGCIVARSNEAKAIGIAMGTPYFQARELLSRHNVQVFSSNYTLYGDISSRVMSILSEFTPDIGVYSIDEAFLDFSHIGKQELVKESQKIRSMVRTWTGIPISIGIAGTRTLAKLANRTAKRTPSAEGVFRLDEPAVIADVLSKTDTGDIWGIGSRYSDRLSKTGIRTALELRDADDNIVRTALGVCGLRTVMELRGVQCISIDDAPAARKSICCSRSFGRKIESLKELAEAVAMYTADAAKRLRTAGLAAGALTVFVDTGMFSKQCQHYCNSITEKLPVPTDSTGDLTVIASRMVKGIYRPQLFYKRAGVIFTELEPLSLVQPDLFESRSPKSALLSGALDSINSRFGGGSVFYAAEGTAKPWAMARGRCSPHYTTRWDELLKVGCRTTVPVIANTP
jgi:DNA polymerase V